MPRLTSPRSFFLIALLALAVVGGVIALGGGDDPVPDFNRTAMMVGTSLPSLDSGYQDWPLCSTENRIETLPWSFRSIHWGPASIEGASGCGGCGGSNSFGGNPFTSGMGLALAPPHDIPAGDIGELPPGGHDHPFVLAGTAEVVLPIHLFSLSGRGGFDFHVTLTYRSGVTYSGDFGASWDASFLCYLSENPSTGAVREFLGNWRVEDQYTYSSGTYTSPLGRFNKLEQFTRASNDPLFPSLPYFKMTERCGVVWYFDQVYAGVKNIYGCTKIEDPWGNSFTFSYDLGGGDPTMLTKVTDTEGREMTFTRSSGRITQLTVSNSSIHSDYGNVTVDFTYTSGRLTKIELQKTRLYDGQTGTLPRPYWEFSYYTSGIRDHDLDVVSHCATTVYDFEYATSGTDRCTAVTDADGEVHEYTVDQQSGADYYTQYIDPSDQRQDFVYASSSDRITINKRKDYLEDDAGSNITDPVVTTYSRTGCSCGQITGIEYPDGSEESWTYDGTLGLATQYKRISSSGADADLVKQWTYDTFANKGRMLSTTGWLQATGSPSTKVEYTWSNGLLDTVEWPAVTTGQPSSQAIVWDYDFNADGTLDGVTQPNGDTSEWSYSSDEITRTDDPGGLGREWVTSRDKHGNVTASEDPTGASVTYTVTPDGRLLKVAGANSQESKYTYDLRGRRTQEDKLLVSATSTRVVTDYTVSAGGVMSEIKVNDVQGTTDAVSTFAMDHDDADRFQKSIDPDKYGSKSKWGYGSYSLPWKEYNRDENPGTPVDTLTLTLKRNTMGRVTTQVLMGGTEIDYGYDGYGRLVTTTTDLPSSATRVTTLTLKSWGGVEKEEVTVGGTSYAITNHYYDEANREWKVMREDPENVLADRIVEFVRDSNGRVAQREDELGNVWETQWDDVGRVSKTIEPTVSSGANEVRYAYNDSTRATTITSHEYNTDTSAYTDYVVVETRDASGRVSNATNQGSSGGDRDTDYVYDEGNRRTQMTTELGFITKYEYDKMGRMSKEEKPIDRGATPALIAPTETTLSIGGRRMRVTDANSNETEWTYDSFGRELTIRYENGGSHNTTTRTYDSYGRLDTITDASSSVVDYHYDAGGRNTQIDITKSSGELGPDRIVLVYDAMDRVTSGKTQVNSGGYSDVTSVTRAYNGFGEMEQEVQYGSRTFDFSYDDAGRVQEITFPSGGPVLGVRHSFDAAGRLDKVERKLNTTVEGISSSTWQDSATFKYIGHREIKRDQTARYDLMRTQSWTSFREPALLEYKKNSTSAVRSGLSCYWDGDGRMTVRVRTHDSNGVGEVFRYNQMDCLTKMWRDVQSASGYTASDPTDAGSAFDDKMEYVLGKVYERDKTKVTPDSGSTTTTEYSNNGYYQYTAVGSVSPTWSSDGNCTDYDTWSYAWTALNQLAEADPDSGTTREYTYDAFGRRVETKVGAAVSKYIYVGWHMVGEHDGSSWLWQEVAMPGEDMLEHLAKDTNDLDTDSNTTEIRQYAVHTDFQATVWGLTDTSGNIVERYRYREPYGDTYTQDSGGSNIGDFESNVYHQKRLHGGVVDKVSERYDLRNRWLMPACGSWLLREPLGCLEVPNPYQGFLADTLQRIDPFGTTTIQLCDGGSEAVGGTGCNFGEGCLDIPPPREGEQCSETKYGDIDLFTVCCKNRAGKVTCEMFRVDPHTTDPGVVGGALGGSSGPVRCRCEWFGPSCAGASKVGGTDKDCSGATVIYVWKWPRRKIGSGGKWNPEMICSLCNQMAENPVISALPSACSNCCKKSDKGFEPK